MTDQHDHRERYPEQYTHPLCGKRVRVFCTYTSNAVLTEGTVTRVVSTRFGLLAHLDDGRDAAYSVSDCHLDHNEGAAA